MKYISRIFAIALIILSCTACESRWNPDELMQEEGTLDLSTLVLGIDTNVEVVSRTGEDLSDYTVKVLDAATGDIAYQWVYSQIPASVKLRVGDYILDVENSPLQPAAFDAPWIHASQKFSVKKDETTELGTLTCKISNVLASARFSDGLKAAVGNDVKVQIFTDDNAPLSFEIDDQRGPGYFALAEGASTIVATFEGTVGGRLVKLRKTFGGVVAGQHHVITFSLNTGTMDPAIIVDADISYENVDINIPGSEDPQVGPTITSETVDLAGENIVSPDMTVDMLITAPAGIAHLYVTIKIVGFTAEDLVNIGLAERFDLVEPGDCAEVLAELGFPLEDKVKDQTEVIFDISEFMGILGAIPGKHQFILDVVDNNGITSSVTLNLTCLE